MPNFTAFLSYVLIANFAPGPNTIMSMSNASRYGFKKSIMFNVGIFFGVFILFALSSIFSMALYSFIPSIKSIMSCVGATYMIWLAWQTYKSKPNSEDKPKKRTNTFLSGLLLQFVNPNVIIYGLATVSTFIVPYYKSVFILTSFSVILAFLGFVGTCCWSLFGSVFQKVLAKHYKVFNIVMALLLVYCAVSLFR
ncbi:LysE family transporter [Clostridium magnum]|uniref:Cysteine/O-acetylserine efflux protein n=1 Tax=Clostridium magnum DSM 2767 TaxID=1121326 RepID=A0A162REI4_9CLOT|nr:LysE family transporter [Clostridium magnum]KZL89783.1 cysteine/O-acetylserine efflux protein [Clostridium magnum DSM 2767]SHH66856.1 Threonine/homoserine/homoserine lactone efflux protein [Clostridium magnum DSM 2767]